MSEKGKKVVASGAAVTVAAGLFYLLWRVSRDDRTKAEMTPEEQMDVDRTAQRLDAWYLRLARKPSTAKLAELVRPSVRRALRRHTEPDREEP